MAEYTLDDFRVEMRRRGISKPGGHPSRKRRVPAGPRGPRETTAMFNLRVVEACERRLEQLGKLKRSAIMACPWRHINPIGGLLAEFKALADKAGR